MVNFHPHHNNHSEKSDGEVEEGEDEETLDDSGGFCQPASLATFVANELTQQNEEQLSPRMKRSHYACSIQEEVDVKRCRGD